MQFGLACCAIEMMATGASRYDTGAVRDHAARLTPPRRTSLIVAGTVDPEDGHPREAALRADGRAQVRAAHMALSCANNGGPYWRTGYHVLKGVDEVIPWTVYVPRAARRGRRPSIYRAC